MATSTIKQQNVVKIKILTASIEVSEYTYSLGGYVGEIEISNMDGYDSNLNERTLAYIPIACYFYTNAGVNGVASIFNNKVVVNGSNAGNYYVKLIQLYIS